MWRKVARLCLRGVTVLSPVVLAACYGPGYAGPPTRLVRTVDAVSKAPIPGIKVSCEDSSDGEWTDNRGEAFLVGYCAFFRATDTDGNLNGGYWSATGEGSDDYDHEREPDLVIEMERK